MTEGVYLPQALAEWSAQYTYYCAAKYRPACQLAMDGAVLSERQACELRESVAFDDGIASAGNHRFGWLELATAGAIGTVVGFAVGAILQSKLD